MLEMNKATRGVRRGGGGYVRGYVCGSSEYTGSGVSTLGAEGG